MALNKQLESLFIQAKFLDDGYALDNPTVHDNFYVLAVNDRSGALPGVSLEGAAVAVFCAADARLAELHLQTFFEGGLQFFVAHLGCGGVVTA